jgi:hypothetical protein
MKQRELKQVVRDILKLHASTSERLEVEGKFNDEIFEYISLDKNFLDIGGGIYPLMFPWDKLQVENFVLVEKDKQACRAVNLFAQATDYTSKLRVIEKYFEDIDFEKLLEELKIEKFDSVLVFKTIIVLSKKSKGLLHKLSKIPTKKFIITAPTKSLIKKESIDKSEDKALQEFIKISGFKNIHSFNTDTEFGYVLLNN